MGKTVYNSNIFNSTDEFFKMKFNTTLSQEEEISYQEWKKTLPERLQSEIDYDLRGFYKENPTFKIVNEEEDHLTDKYKKPNHPTFSNESIYSNEKIQGGQWVKKENKYVFVPSEQQRKYGIEEIEEIIP